MTEHPFAAPDPSPDEVAVNHFGTPIVGGPIEPYPPSAAPNPAFLAYGPPARTGRPAWVLPVSVVAGVLVVLVSAYVVFSRLRPAATVPATAAPSIDLAYLPNPTAAPSGPVGPAALTAQPPAGSGTVVTPASAHDVLSALWPLRESALTSRDASAVERLETGSARSGDVIRVTCGCLERTTPGVISDATVFVSRQTHYPATFFADVRTTDSANHEWHEMMSFTRAAADQPWLLAFDTGADYTQPTALAEPTTDDAGYAITPTKGEAKVAAAMPARLAAFWQQAKDDGPRTSTWFAPGTWTTQTAAALAAHPNGTVQASGLIGQETFAVDRSTPMTMVRTGSDTLVCAVIRRHYVQSAHDGVLPVQGTGDEPFGPGVAPGVYRTVTTIGTAQTCLFVPDRDGGRDTAVLGGDDLVETTSTASH